MASHIWDLGWHAGDTSYEDSLMPCPMELISVEKIVPVQCVIRAAGGGVDRKVRAGMRPKQGVVRTPLGSA